MKTIAIDFDGVIHQYSKGYADGTIYDPLVPGAKEFLIKSHEKGHPIFIMSTRNPVQIYAWIQPLIPELTFGILVNPGTFFNNKKLIGITNKKLAAHIYIDDRGYTFKGYFPDVDKFETYQEREKRRVICPNKDENGNCPLHNIHCQYPDCEIKEL
jgi:hypothetical protein